MRLVAQLTQNIHQLMSGVMSVSRHKKPSAAGGSFASQVGLFAQQNFVLLEPPVLQLVPICHLLQVVLSK